MFSIFLFSHHIEVMMLVTEVTRLGREAGSPRPALQWERMMMSAQPPLSASRRRSLSTLAVWRCLTHQPSSDWDPSLRCSSSMISNSCSQLTMTARDCLSWVQAAPPPSHLHHLQTHHLMVKMFVAFVARDTPDLPLLKLIWEPTAERDPTGTARLQWK